MASECYKVERVLEKLRERLLSGEPSTEYEWKYDSSNTSPEEDKALGILESLGVLRTRINTAAYEIEANGAIRYNSTKDGTRTRTIIEFNPAEYEKACSRYGIEPYNELYTARLSFIDEVTPTVEVGTEQFEFRSMYEGKPASIIRHCLKHVDEVVTVKELRNAGVNPLTYIPQVFKESLFSKTGALAPFVRVTPDTIKLTPVQKLNREQISLIRSTSK